MDYEIKCPKCGSNLLYIYDKDIEDLGGLSFDCINGCYGGYIFPKNHPKIKSIKE